MQTYWGKKGIIVIVEKWMCWYEAYEDDPAAFYVCKARFKKGPQTLMRLEAETKDEALVQSRLGFRTRFKHGERRFYDSERDAYRELLAKLEEDKESLQTRLTKTKELIDQVKCRIAFDKTL